jgi:4,5-DOPA dioxygenase extradiol
VVKPRWVGLDVDSWGLDHGTWSVLTHMFPGADVPVVQLSINALQPLDYHLDIGRRLAPLRDEGVLIVASGNVVHNLRRIDWTDPASGFDWARRFGDAAREVLSSSPGDVLRLVEHRDFELAVPTPDHFIPLLYTAGLAAEAGDTFDALIDGYAYGSLSMACYALGADCTVSNSQDPAATIPSPDEVPLDQSNL